MHGCTTPLISEEIIPNINCDVDVVHCMSCLAKTHIEEDNTPDFNHDCLKSNEEGNLNEDYYNEVIQSMQGPMEVAYMELECLHL